MASIVIRKGKYCVSYRIEDESGRKRQRWETFETKADAVARKQEIEHGFTTIPLEITSIKTVSDMMREYVNIYGVNNWALSTYAGVQSVLKHYIDPIIGDMKLEDVTTRVIDQYYQSLLKVKAVPKGNDINKRQYLSPKRVREVHKILRGAYNQALRWGVVEKNPTLYATLPKVKKTERAIWTAEQLFKAIEICEEPRMKLALNLAFSCSLRQGEMLGLTWDCVDIDPRKIAAGTASIYIEKELQRVGKDSLGKLDHKDVIMEFPNINPKNTTRLVLKTPKTASSIRRIFLPRTVAEMLVEWKEDTAALKTLLGDEYVDYGLVFAHENGRPVEGSRIRHWLQDIIDKGDLPQIVFHSIRHTSITYKLKLNGGDIKAVQGDSGHSQVKMVTDVYSHIMDEDRKKMHRILKKPFTAERQEWISQRAETVRKWQNCLKRWHPIRRCLSC